ncbi:MAG: SDR family oxidoreductase [Pseudomonadota bacterium]|nr:SDR family oxidoreductase [Pseudomonadota bacterium]
MKHAFVTGGGGDIGAAIGLRAAASGYRVCLVDQDDRRVKEHAAALAGAIGLQCDVTDEASVEAAFDTAIQQIGSVPDLVVNCAGIARFAPLIDQTLADFRRVLDVNLTSGFIVSRAAARRMLVRGSGCIVNVTSINGISPAPLSGAYPASKSGLAALTELMAVEWGPLGLRVNSVAPGFIDAGLSAPFFANQAVRDLREKAVPTRRLGTAADIAEAVVFLGSDAASYVNGHQLVVDGGASRALLALLPREAPVK